MMNKTLTLALLTLLAFQQAYADSPQQYQTCIACHGANAEGNSALGAPAIAGQDAAYLRRQLNAFRTGQRGKESAQAKTMAAAVSMLDEATADLLTDWLAQQAVVKTAAQGDTSGLRNGENLYNANCGACHGAAGKGNALMGAPRLAGMNSDYMARQYRAFQSGARGSHDRYGKQMAMMAKAVGDKGLQDTLNWLQVQGEQ